MSEAFVAGSILKLRRHKSSIRQNKVQKCGPRASLGGLEVFRFEQYFLAGGVCALLTHSALTPVDVVKTRLQTRPGAYSDALDVIQRIVKFEGAAVLLTGLGATAGGYFMHGALKYSCYELFHSMNAPSAIAALSAECIASAALCPLEAVRIRAVADSEFPRGVITGIRSIVRNENLYGLYKGLPPLLLRQVPYTVAQFVAFEWMRKVIGMVTGMNNEIEVDFVAGLLAGIAAAVVSHPGDSILSQVNKDSRGAVLKGKFFVGLAPRLLWVSCLIGSQFAIYDYIKILFLRL